MTKPQPFRVGIVGLSPQGRDLVERLSLQSHCELLLYPTSKADSEKSLPLANVSSITDWQHFLFRSELNVVLFLEGLALQPDQLQAALEAKIPTYVLPPLTGEPAQWQQFCSAAPEQLRLLSPHYENRDFRAALAWVQSGETGIVTAIKRISWVPNLIEPDPQDPSPDGWFSRWLWDDVDQLLCLTGAMPQSVFAAEFSEDDQRYFLVFQFAEGLVAHLERRRSSVVPLDWGWTFTGPSGGYAKQQRFIKTEAGEIYDVPAELPPLEGDPLFAPLSLTGDTLGLDSSWGHALKILRVYQAMRASAQSGQATPI